MCHFSNALPPTLIVGMKLMSHVPHKTRYDDVTTRCCHSGEKHRNANIEKANKQVIKLILRKIIYQSRRFDSSLNKDLRLYYYL